MAVLATLAMARPEVIAIAADRSSSSCLLRESLTVICRRQRMVFMLAAASRRPGAARRPGERKGDERAHQHRQPKCVRDGHLLLLKCCVDIPLWVDRYFLAPVSL